MATEAVFSAESSNLSALHALFYAHSGTDLEGLLSTDQGAQQDRIVGGSIRVSEAMAAALGDRVTLDSPVRRIVQERGRVSVTTRDGEVYEADRTIVTLPPTLAGRLEYAPALPSWRDQLTQRLPAGSVIKLYAVYEEPFWRADGLTGQAASDQGPVKVTFDNSPPEGTPGVLMGFMEANDGRAAARLTVEERRDAAVACFVRYFGPRAARSRRVPRAGLDGRGVQPGLLRRPLHARGVGRLRVGPDRAGRPRPLGRCRVLVGVERVHGGGGPVR